MLLVRQVISQSGYQNAPYVIRYSTAKTVTKSVHRRLVYCFDTRCMSVLYYRPVVHRRLLTRLCASKCLSHEMKELWKSKL
ncbi:hypothetical protein AHF37_04338 [Paragonimus kellicotti]|nr:hypothetical protein AHF37_04338 [Paragonimus kellicotti]